MNKSILNQFRATVAESHLRVLGVNVYHNGEEIEHRYVNSVPINLHSASKTFTSVGVGIAIDEGLITLDDKVVSFFPELSANAPAGHEMVTIRDLLHMGCGIDTSGKLLPSAFTRDDDGKDYLESYFACPSINKAGSTFTYDNINTYLLARIISKLTNKHFSDYLQPRLFDKLDIQIASWINCPKGHCIAAGGLILTTEEFHRLGKMLLFKGEYKGKQVVSQQYVNAMYEDIIDTTSCGWEPNNCKGYGYQVWRCNKEGAFRADGALGQYSVVDPALNAVVTVTSYEDNMGAVCRAIIDDILPNID